MTHILHTHRGYRLVWAECKPGWARVDLYLAGEGGPPERSYKFLMRTRTEPSVPMTLRQTADELCEVAVRMAQVGHPSATNFA